MCVLAAGAAVNPSTAFGTVFADELARCGVREVVIAPGSRSTPLAMSFYELERAGRVRLHVRIDERSASFTALGLAKAGGRPVAVLCTSGTAAANFHPAVIEADESAVPLLVLTADRPPELRGAGASQTINQVKLYGGAVRWYAEPGVPEKVPGLAAYWRSLACQAWAHAAGAAGTCPGPVHVNLPFRDPLVPDGPGPGDGAADGTGWPDSLDGRPGGAPWTRVAGSLAAEPLDLPWAERGIVVCGDGVYDAAPLVELAERAGWPVLAEPSSGARRGPNALTGYQYLLAAPEFMAAHRPSVIVSAGRPGLSRPQSAVVGLARSGAPVRHVVVAQGPGRWADPQRAATDVAAAIRLTGVPAVPDGAPGGWLDDWRRADAAAVAGGRCRAGAARLAHRAAAGQGAARRAAGERAAVGGKQPVSQGHRPGHGAARGRARAGEQGGQRDRRDRLDGRRGGARARGGASGRPGVRADRRPGVPARRGRAGDRPAEPRPDLCLVVANNDGGGIFETLEQAAFNGVFERLFGTPHGASVEQLAAAFGVPYTLVEQPGELAKAVSGTGLRIVEARTDRAANAALRARMRAAATQAVVRAVSP